MRKRGKQSHYGLGLMSAEYRGVRVVSHTGGGIDKPRVTLTISEQPDRA
jgi:hypothetical protein